MATYLLNGNGIAYCPFSNSSKPLTLSMIGYLEEVSLKVEWIGFKAKLVLFSLVDLQRLVLMKFSEF